MTRPTLPFEVIRDPRIRPIHPQESAVVDAGAPSERSGPSLAAARCEWEARKRRTHRGESATPRTGMPWKSQLDRIENQVIAEMDKLQQLGATLRRPPTVTSKMKTNRCDSEQCPPPQPTGMMQRPRVDPVARHRWATVPVCGAMGLTGQVTLLTLCMLISARSCTLSWVVRSGGW